MKRLFILAVIIFVNACATQVTSLKQGDKITLEANKGFVLLGIQTSQSLKTIRISGPQNIELNSNDVKEGTNYLLIDLKAGKYTIDRLDLDNYRYIDFDNDEYWEFNVSPGQISYVGRVDRHSQALEDIQCQLLPSPSQNRAGAIYAHGSSIIPFTQ